MQIVRSVSKVKITPYNCGHGQIHGITIPPESAKLYSAVWNKADVLVTTGSSFKASKF